MTLGFLAGMLVPELVIKVISLETGEIFMVEAAGKIFDEMYLDRVKDYDLSKQEVYI